MKNVDFKKVEKELLRLAQENDMNLKLIRCYNSIIVEFKKAKTDSVENFVDEAMNISSKIGFQEYLDISIDIQEDIYENNLENNIDSVEEYILKNQLSMF